MEWEVCLIHSINILLEKCCLRGVYVCRGWVVGGCPHKILRDVVNIFFKKHFFIKLH